MLSEYEMSGHIAKHRFMPNYLEWRQLQELQAPALVESDGSEGVAPALNQCYNDIVKLIIDLIPVKHNMPKDFYQSKKIVAGLGMNY
jgi:hypothetical protein